MEDTEKVPNLAKTMCHRFLETNKFRQKKQVRAGKPQKGS